MSGAGSPLGQLPPELLERVVTLAVPSHPTSLHLDLPPWMAMGGVDNGESSGSGSSDDDSDSESYGFGRAKATWRAGRGGGGGGGADLDAAARCI